MIPFPVRKPIADPDVIVAFTGCDIVMLPVPIAVTVVLAGSDWPDVTTVPTEAPAVLATLIVVAPTASAPDAVVLAHVPAPLLILFETRLSVKLIASSVQELEPPA